MKPAPYKQLFKYSLSPPVPSVFHSAPELP